MPVIGAVMVGAAAGVDILCLWQWDRSTLNVVATAVTVLAALGAAVILLASSGTDHWTHRPRVMGSREWLTMVARRLGAGWPAVVAMLLNLMVALGAFALVALG